MKKCALTFEEINEIQYIDNKRNFILIFINQNSLLENKKGK